MAGDTLPTGDEQITWRGWLLVTTWAAALVVLLAAIGWYTVSQQRQSRAADLERHQARMDPVATEPGLTAGDIELPVGANPTRVYIGIYVDRIVELSLKDGSWTVDFYLWFRWQGSDVRPGDNSQVVDGAIESKEKEVEYVSGQEHYERYRVVAKISKFFEVSRFPCDDHLLTINIENPAYQRHELMFVADTENSSVSSRVKVPAYEIYQKQIIEKPHSYKTTRGDPRLKPGVKSTYSQCRMGISIRRPDWGFYLKMFQALYIAVGIAMLAMFIKPTDVDPRFGLGVGGLFAAVANSYVTASLVPDTGAATLADAVNGIGTAMILLTVAQSTISLYLYDRQGAAALSRLFDKVSVVLLVAGYAVLNLALPLAAIYRQ